jgi:hypothetical protein
MASTSDIEASPQENIFPTLKTVAQNGRVKKQSGIKTDPFC